MQRIFSILLISVVMVAGCCSPQKNSNEKSHRVDERSVDRTQAPSFKVLSVKPDPVYGSMLRPRDDGWLGSDVAYSIPLSAKKSVWLFGDTFIGTLKDGKRVGTTNFINSTLGIQDRTLPPDRAMTYYWKMKDGKPQSFFPWQEETPGDYYWSTMGILLEGELFVFCYAMDYDAIPKWIAGTAMIRISNPQDPPDQWIQKAYDFGLQNTPIGFHSAVYAEGEYVYFFGSMDGSMHLGRASKKDLLGGGLGDVLQFWAKGENGGYWSKKPENLVPLFAPGITETGVHYEPKWGLYFMTAYRADEPTIYLTVARDLRGPWSEPVGIYEIPEHKVSFPIISYAVRPHPELSTRPGELLITYNTNAPHTVDKLFTEEGFQIYQPRFIRVQVGLE